MTVAFHCQVPVPVVSHSAICKVEGEGIGTTSSSVQDGLLMQPASMVAEPTTTPSEMLPATCHPGGVMKVTLSIT